jgi:hypothetical protein
MKMNINATRRLHSSFSPESKIECCLIWQVFWLGVYFNAFPLIKIVAKIEASRTPSSGGVGEAPYSYGDSAGFPPDFPFNLF